MRRAFSLVVAVGLCGIAFDVGKAADVEDPAEWRRIAMDRALMSAEAIDDSYRLSQALTEISRALRLIEDDHRAEAALRKSLQVAGRIEAPEFRGWALHDIVTAQIAAADVIGARQTGETITADRPQSAALAALADIELRAGRLAAAQAIAARIRERQDAGKVWRQIVVYQVNHGDLDAARATAKKISDRFYQGIAFGDIAVAEVRAGDGERALSTASRAHRLQRSQARGRVAIARAQKGDLAGATAVLGKIDDAVYRALVQGQIAALRAKAGDTSTAHELFQAALSSLDGVRENGSGLPSTLSQLARLQAGYGDRTGALDTLRRAIAASDKLSGDERKDDVLDTIARGQMRLGDEHAALATGMQIRNPITRALLVRDLVTGQVRSGVAVEAIRREIPADEALTETAALFGILGAQMYAPGRIGAAETIALARDAVREIDNLELKPAALATLAAARVTLADVRGGAEIFEEALAASKAIERPDKRVGAYVRLVNALDERLMFLGQPAKRDGGD